MSDNAIRSNPVFLRKERTPNQPAPMLSRGLIAWLRQNFFSDVTSTILTLVSLAFLIWIIPGLLRFFFFDAVWSAPDGKACRAPGTGMCWAFIGQKLDSFRYGLYPRDQTWRVDVTIMAGAILGAKLLWPAQARGFVHAAVFIIAVPLVSFEIAPGWTAAFAQPLSGLLLIAGFAAAALVWTSLNLRRTTILFLIVFPIAGLFLLRGAGFLGLQVIDGDLWGGIIVTFVISIVGIVASLPLGIALALGRRSKLPIIKFFSVLFIEFVRGVPLITVLYVANTMLPLFVPENLSPDRLSRPLIGVAVFASAYMAEVVRGGLAAVPKGQYEGAMALGLPYSRMMRLVVLPQALTLVIPNIVNTFIGLFKDSTLVAAVGIFDFLGMINTAIADPVWAGPSIATTGFIFAAMFYWVFCFGMSRYSLMTERKLAAGRRR